MKTSFSYFPGMFENTAPAKIIKEKKNLKCTISGCRYLGIRKFEFVAKTKKKRDLPRRIPVMMSKASNGVENLKSSITPTEGGAAGLSSFFSSGLSS